MWKKWWLWGASLTLILLVGTSAAQTLPPRIQPIPVPLPGGSGGIGFDDLGYDAQLRQILVPAGRTGDLDLIDSATRVITPIKGFSAQDQFGGGHGEGTTSADSGRGVLFATDRTRKQVTIIDPTTKTIVGAASVSGDPDYVRYVALTQELWITEPDQEQIEIFSLSAGSTPTPIYSAVISLPGGPESLVIDQTRRRAYTHLWAGKTVAVDLTARAVVAQWSNGCSASRGIALDEARGFLFAGCSEGKAVVLDLNHDGQQLASLDQGSGVDVISYNPTLKHLYLPGAVSATMGILDVSPDGKLSLLGIADTASGAHCVTADDQGNAWVCDPDHGQLLLVKDPFPASPDSTQTSES